MADKKGLFSFLKLESILDNLTGYVEKRMALFKIELKEDLSQAASKLVVVIILVVTGSMVLLFVSLGLALFLNNVFKSNNLGFFAVSGFYLVIFLFFFFFKDKINLEKHLQKKFHEIFSGLSGKNGINRR